VQCDEHEELVDALREAHLIKVGTKVWLACRNSEEGVLRTLNILISPV
jgi:hypothetical protein